MKKTIVILALICSVGGVSAGLFGPKEPSRSSSSSSGEKKPGFFSRHFGGSKKLSSMSTQELQRELEQLKSQTGDSFYQIFYLLHVHHSRVGKLFQARSKALKSHYKIDEIKDELRRRGIRVQ